MTERRLLQIAVAVACVVPIGGGLAGALFGAEAFGHDANVSRDLDSHVRYLSGLLLAIGLGFACAIPLIERRRALFRVMAGIVIVGGFARLVGVVVDGWPSATMTFALVMELGVTPALALWRERVHRRLAKRRVAELLARAPSRPSQDRP